MTQPPRIPICLLSLCAALPACHSATTTPRMSPTAVLALAEPAMQSHFPADFESKKPYHSEFYDGIWHVRGTLPADTIGGTPEAEIRDLNHALLRVYHTQ